MVDNKGRIQIWDCYLCSFLRVLKGYRRTQIGWLYINHDVFEFTQKIGEQKPSCPSTHQHGIFPMDNNASNITIKRAQFTVLPILIILIFIQVMKLIAVIMKHLRSTIWSDNNKNSKNTHSSCSIFSIRITTHVTTSFKCTFKYWHWCYTKS